MSDPKLQPPEPPPLRNPDTPPSSNGRAELFNRFGRFVWSSWRRRVATVVIGVFVLLVVIAGLAGESDDEQAERASADEQTASVVQAEPLPDAEAEREALRTIGNELCSPNDEQEISERDALYARLEASLGRGELSDYWLRATKGKSPSEGATAFFGCAGLTSWMRDAAVAEGIDVDAFIQASASDGEEEPEPAEATEPEPEPAPPSPDPAPEPPSPEPSDDQTAALVLALAAGSSSEQFNDLNSDFQDCVAAAESFVANLICADRAAVGYEAIAQDGEQALEAARGLQLTPCLDRSIKQLTQAYQIYGSLNQNHLSVQDVEQSVERLDRATRYLQAANRSVSSCDSIG